MLHKTDIQVKYFLKHNGYPYDMKRFTLRIEEDEYGDNYIHIPDDVMKECGWDIGTNLEYEEETDGSIILHKIDE